MTLLFYAVVVEYKYAYKFIVLLSEYNVVKLAFDRLDKEIKTACELGTVNLISSLLVRYLTTPSDVLIRVNHVVDTEKSVVTMICNKFHREIIRDCSKYYELVYRSTYVNLLIDCVVDNDALLYFFRNQWNYIEKSVDVSRFCKNNVVLQVILRQDIAYSERNSVVHTGGVFQWFLGIPESDPMSVYRDYTYASLWIFMHNEKPPLSLAHSPSIVLGTERGKNLNIATLWKKKFPHVELPAWMKKESEYQKIVTKFTNVPREVDSTDAVYDGYIYILQRDCYKGTNKYKIGKTINWESRRKAADYRNSDLYFLMRVNGMSNIENELKTMFSVKYTYDDIDEHGTEDYCGDVRSMIRDAVGVIFGVNVGGGNVGGGNVVGGNSNI
jgi:hypothetical protein